jgi:hypothetical protein
VNGLSDRRGDRFLLKHDEVLDTMDDRFDGDFSIQQVEKL